MDLVVGPRADIREMRQGIWVDMSWVPPLIVLWQLYRCWEIWLRSAVLTLIDWFQLVWIFHLAYLMDCMKWLEPRAHPWEAWKWIRSGRIGYMSPFSFGTIFLDHRAKVVACAKSRWKIKDCLALIYFIFLPHPRGWVLGESPPYTGEEVRTHTDKVANSLFKPWIATWEKQLITTWIRSRFQLPCLTLEWDKRIIKRKNQNRNNT